MNNTRSRLKRIKVDALYGKKKHFNAADRHEKRHLNIGVPLVIINVLTGSILFYVITEDQDNWIKYIPLIFALAASLLSGFQTFLNPQKKVEGHRRVGNRYLAIMKKCDRLQAYIADEIIEEEQLINRIEEIAAEVEEVNKEAESFPTNEEDYKKAKKGIESGEENYTDEELNL